MGFFLNILTLIFFSAFAHASQPISSLGESHEWRALLHYKKNKLGFERSEVDGLNFFLSPDGSTDSSAEFKADLDAFLLPVSNDPTGEKNNEHALCKFPARAEWMRRNGLLPSNFLRPKCKILDTYTARIQSQKVSIVFSSYFLGSSSSVFGHSFLRFSGENENELFDTGINFSANPTTSNPILFAVYGLIGVFPGTYSAQPYYFKVREYNDYESRDLWTYELNLTKEENQYLLYHLWELGNTSFAYFYFNENCSYQIMRAIEATVPRIVFFQNRPIYLIPSESIRVLSEHPDLIRSVAYRPSIRNLAYTRFEKLTPLEKDWVLAELDRSKNKPALKVTAAMMDALIDAIDLNYAEDLAKKDPEITEWKQSVLKRRAQIEEVTPPLVLPAPAIEDPSLGHSSRRFLLGYGSQSVGGNAENYTHFQVRASHHDLLDPSPGFPPNLHIDFGRLAFKYLHESHSFLLNELTLVDLTSLAIEHPLQSRFSYEAYIGFNRNIFADCEDALNCKALSGKVGFGKAYSFLNHQTFYFMADLIANYGTNFYGSKFKITASPTANLLFSLGDQFKLSLQGAPSYTLFTLHPLGISGNAEARYNFSKLWSLGVITKQHWQSGVYFSDYSLRGMLYF